MSRIMLVDDDITTRWALAECLTSLEYDVIGQAESATEAIEMARTLNPDLILMDIVLPGQMDGISAAEQIKRETDAVIIFLTGYGNVELLERAKRLEPYGYLMKPWTDLEVRACVEIALYKKKADRKLLESEKKYRNLVENINDVIFSLNPAGIVTFISPTIERITGYAAPELTGKILPAIVYPEDRPGVEKWIQEILHSLHSEYEYIEPSEYRILHKSGNIRWVTSSSRQILQDGKAVGIQGVLTDITHTRIMEEKLWEARKMEAVGTLAGGIAHEINNLLGIILGRVELTLLDFPESSPNKKSLKEILNASIKAREVVRQLLCFARKSLTDLKPIDINAIVEKSIQPIIAPIPETIEIRLDLTSEPQTILADPAEITQILANLYSNAAHAMRKKGGIVDVGVSPISIHAESPEQQKEMGSGDFVKLTVGDSGEGMAPHVMARIFDPYFTTREVGEGTGMGMAIVYAFVKKCNGEIHVKSEIDKGTVVELLFPKYQDTGPSSS